MKFFYAVLLLVCHCSWSQTDDRTQIDNMITSWHRAAAEAKFDVYFSHFTDNAVFIGTDPTENWNLKSFKEFSNPFFDRGRAWNFRSIERNIYLSDDGKTAWFDELLDTRNMKLCRGSGVARKIDGSWKIAHYVLSMTIPNDNTLEVVNNKSAFDDALIKTLKSR